jgi:NADPH:quinone reductase-like Zn-dependent oxidoreductase
MKAFEIDPTRADGLLQMVERSVPEPQLGEVLVRVAAASLNYRDLLVARNFYGLTTNRLIPLSDGSGEIVAVGPGVPDDRMGERVAGAFFPDWITGPVTAARRQRSFGAQIDGMLAEYAVMPAHAAIPMPEHLSDVEAAALPCAGVTAWNALTSAAQISPGMTVLLQGSGGVSIMALQFAKMIGARVIQITSSAEKRLRLSELGADEIIDYVAEPDWHKSVLRLTDGEGADVVVDIGGPGTLSRSARAVKVGGTVVSVGFAIDGPGLDPQMLIGRAIKVIGITVGSCDMFREMMQAVAIHRMHPVLHRVLPMAQAAEAYDLLRQGRHIGKIALSIPGDASRAARGAV